MKKTGRPVSPHVTIYAFPVGALSSITNRVTGVALSLGAAGLGAIEIVAGSGTSLELMQMIGSQGFLIAGPAKCKLSGQGLLDIYHSMCAHSFFAVRWMTPVCVSFPIVYHYIGAIRHLAWDYVPDYLENADVEKSSMALFGASTVISAGTMFL